MVYRYLSLVLFLIFILNATMSHGKALENNLWKTDSGSYLFLYQENGKYILNEIKIPQDQNQKIIDTKIFNTKDSALNAVSKINRHALNLDSVKFPDVPTGEPVLGIWPTQNEWSWSWEIKYSEWIIENFNSKFFVHHKIKTDCADVAVALRWIFARINHLPAVQTLAVTNRLFSNETLDSTWADLPTSENWNEDQRFLTALNYVLENTYTHTLYKDSYPILIDPSVLLMGTHLQQLHEDGGHTMIVYEYYKNKTLYTLASTTPRKIRTLDRRGFWELSQPVYTPKIEDGSGGFLRMRWAVKTADKIILKPRKEMPFFSTEQFDPTFISKPNQFGYGFSDEVHQRFGSTATKLDRVTEIVENTIRSWQLRVSIVEEGYNFCKVNDCNNNENYDNHSTPNRDYEILYSLIEAESFVWQFEESNPELKEYWDSQMNNTIVTIEEHSLTFAQLHAIWMNSLYKTDPNEPILARWGINPELSYQK